MDKRTWLILGTVLLLSLSIGAFFFTKEETLTSATTPSEVKKSSQIKKPTLTEKSYTDPKNSTDPSQQQTVQSPSESIENSTQTKIAPVSISFWSPVAGTDEMEERPVFHQYDYVVYTFQLKKAIPSATVHIEIQDPKTKKKTSTWNETYTSLSSDQKSIKSGFKPLEHLKNQMGKFQLLIYHGKDLIAHGNFEVKP